MEVVANINRLLKEGGNPQETMHELQKSEAQLPEVEADYPNLYHDQLLQLLKLKQDNIGAEEVNKIYN